MAPFGLDSVKKLVSKKTKAILFSYLYGIRFDIGPYMDFLEENKIDVLEDLAEAFGGFNFVRGHPRARLSMFSFGLIKIQTTFMGNISVIRDDEELHRSMNEIQRTYVTHTKKDFYLKCWKATKAIFYINTKVGFKIIDHQAKV